MLTGHHVSGWEETANGVRAFLNDKDGNEIGNAESSLLIACDGIYSTIRAKLYPEEGSPIWAKRILWRGVTKAKPFLTGRSMIMAGYQQVKFVAYPISRDDLERGEPTINWIAERELAADYDSAARGLQPRGQARGICAVVRELEFRLARCTGAHPRRGIFLRVSAGGPRSAGTLDLRPRDAHGRRRTPDVSDRLERLLAGDPRRARAGAGD